MITRNWKIYPAKIVHRKLVPAGDVVKIMLPLIAIGFNEHQFYENPLYNILTTSKLFLNII